MYKPPFWKIVLIKIKWSPWNPWCLAKLNLAWRKYTQTPMYESRKALEERFPLDFKDFAYNSFIVNGEVFFFIKKITWKEKILIFFMPFSFGNRFKMPLYRAMDFFKIAER